MVDPGKERLLDEYLVLAAQTGDAGAFDQLARRWQPKLAAHAWRLLGERGSARDAVQESWLEIVRGLGRLRDVRAFPAWAFRIVSRRCAREVGALVGRRRMEAELQAAPDAATEEPAGATASERERLSAAIRSLPPEQRAAIALFHFEELSVAETAVALDVPAGTVKTRLMHARRKLRAVLEGDM
jgi:RNA polymerase sigma factor (sigma-70 family)